MKVPAFVLLLFAGSLAAQERPPTTANPLAEFDALHIVERLSYVDRNRIAYEITIEDPKLYTKAVKNSRTWVRMKEGEELMEYWCMENNRDLLDGHVDHLRKGEAFKKYFEID